LAGHSALRDDTRARLRAAGAKGGGEQAFVVAVGARGVEHRDSRIDRRGDRVPHLLGRHAHAAEADPQLAGLPPALHYVASRGAGGGDRRPATRYGCSTSATPMPFARAAPAAAARSRACTPPPAP